jgi:ribonuclease-3
MADAFTNPDLSRETVEALIGQSVGDTSLFRRALTHRSYLRHAPDRSLRSNERLEFLGDALLDFVVGEALYHRFPEKNEGYLSRLRSKLVSGRSLVRSAHRMGLGEHLLMSENAVRDHGRDHPSVLEDAFEALVGAVYLDRGHEAARQFVHRHVLDPIDLPEVAAHDRDYKSRFQEYLQARSRPLPTYRVVRESGPSHDKTFSVEVTVDGISRGRGTAGSKKAAEQAAAREALEAARGEDDGEDDAAGESDADESPPDESDGSNGRESEAPDEGAPDPGTPAQSAG